MPKLIGRFNSLVIPLITWVVLLIPFAVYQRYYVKTQQAYLTEHGFRLLSAVGRQLDTYIDSINKTVKAAQKASLEVPSKFETELKQKNGPKEKQKVFLDFMRTFHPELPIEAQSIGNPTSCMKPKVLSVEFGAHSTSYGQCFESPVPGRLTLDSYIRDRLAGIGEDYFDDVLIARTTGEVLFQRSLDNQISNLNYLVSSGSPVPPNPQTDANPKSPTPKETLSFQLASGSSSVRPVKVGGEDYNLFLQPFRLTAAGNDATDEGRIVLCGLWRTERLDSDSFALPYSYVVWFALICVAAGSFIWPFLKINYMNKAERLRRSQGLLLVLSMFLGMSSVTLMVLNWSYSSWVQNQVDRDLKILANEIQSKVTSELTSALGQLNSLNMKRLVQEGRNGSSSSDSPAKMQVKYFKDYEIQFDDFKNGSTYPYFDIAFLTDQSGNQIVKYTIDRFSTPQTPIDDRPFFQEIAAGQPNRLATIDKEHYYSLQALFSPNTGLFSTVIATPVEFGSGKRGIQALVFRPLSLVDPVLPADFGFAVLNRDGNVLFHSNSLRNISENFVQECKDQSSLQAAIFSNLEQKMDIVYSGKNRRALVTRIRNLGPEPLTLIVFFNAETTQTTNMAIILIGSALMAFYIGILLLFAAVDLLREYKYPPALIWPRREFSFRYILVAAVNCVLIIGFLLRFSDRQEVNLLFVTAVDLVISVFTTILVLNRKRLPDFISGCETLFQTKFKITYVAAAVSLLIAVTVIPCFGFFKFSRDAAIELAAKHGQLKVLNDVLQHEARVRKDYSDLKPPELTADNELKKLNEIAEKRNMSNLAHYESVPLNFLSFKNQVEEGGMDDSAFQIEFDRWLGETSRMFPSNTLGGEMRMLQFETKGDSEIHPKSSEISFNTFKIVWGLKTIYSQFQPWPGVYGRAWSVLGVLWLLVGGWFFLLMRKIFVPDRQIPLPLKHVRWTDSGQLVGNYLLLGDPHSGKSKRVSAIPGIHYCDLRVEPEKEIKTYSQKDVVVLDNFDFNIGNKTYNQTKLQILERLVYKDGCRVVLVSSVDPVFYFSDVDSTSATDSSQSTTEFLARWVSVMSSFQLVSIEDSARTSFHELLQQKDAEPRPPQLIQWLNAECSHTTYLRSVGTIMFRAHRSDIHFDRRILDNELRERTRSYYSLLWSTLSPGERLILFQLANDGWANNKNEPAIRQLLTKELICSAPMFQVMNESFRLYIRDTQDQRQILEWEQQSRQSSWNSLKIALLATAIGLGAWLFYAQKDLFQGVIGYVLSLGAGVAAIANILGGLKGRAGNSIKSADTSGSA
jgi:hypothetical protein